MNPDLRLELVEQPDGSEPPPVSHADFMVVVKQRDALRAELERIQKDAEERIIAAGRDGQ